MKLRALVVAALIFAGIACRSREASPPNVLLVSIDSLRADHLGAWGYARPTSPFLDSLAATGVRFSAFESLSPWTLPSHTTMLTGLPELAHGVVEMDRSIGPDRRLVAEAFRARGYRTAGVVTGFFVSRKFGFDRGFDLFRDFDVREGEDMRGAKPLGSDAIDTVLEWIGTERTKPFFVFLHLFDVHWPYDPPAPHREAFAPPADADPGPYRGYAHYFDHPLEPRQLENVVARYDGAIHYVDSELARLDRELRARGLEFVTIVTADHGEEFFEHGSWGHAHTVYREQLAIPMLLHGPGIPRGKTVATPADMTDVAPTLLDLAGIAPDPAHPGGSLRSLWENPDRARPERPRISTTSRFHSLALGWRRGGEALVIDLRKQTRELFDERKDRLDAEDLAPGAERRVATLQSELRRGIAESLPTAVRIEWRSLAGATARFETDGAFVSTADAGAVEGFPSALAVPLSDGGEVLLELVPNDAKLRVAVDGKPTAVVAADGSAVGSARMLDLAEPALAKPVDAPPAEGTLRVSAAHAAPSTGAVELSDSEREALRSLGYVSEDP